MERTNNGDHNLTSQGDSLRLLRTTPNTPDQNNDLRFLELTGDLNLEGSTSLPPSPRELSCVTPPVWVNEDLTVDLTTWRNQLMMGGLGEDDDQSHWPSMDPIPWAKNLLMSGLTVCGDGSPLDSMAHDRIMVREALNRVMVRTLTEDNVCPLDALNDVGLRLLHLDGAMMSPIGIALSYGENASTIDLHYAYDEDHKTVVSMVVDSMKSAYSVTAVCRLRDLMESGDLERLSLTGINALDRLDGSNAMECSDGEDSDSCVINGVDLTEVFGLVNVLASVFCPSNVKGRLIVGMLTDALPVRL